MILFIIDFPSGRIGLLVNTMEMLTVVAKKIVYTAPYSTKQKGGEEMWELCRYDKPIHEVVTHACINQTRQPLLGVGLRSYSNTARLHQQGVAGTILNIRTLHTCRVQLIKDSNVLWASKSLGRNLLPKVGAKSTGDSQSHL